MEPSKKSLPENAYRPLKPGETYQPIVPAAAQVPEFTSRSVVFGILMAVLFSAAAASSGLKAGQIFEAAIPIAIIAVGFGLVFRRKSTILENVIVQSIGAASGLVVAGSIFTLPALFILGLPVDLFKLFVVALLGGALGILFLIPFRRYFVREMHGEFPFPEATATTEVLVAGEAGGKQAKVLGIAAAIGGLFDFIIIHLEGWAEVFTSRALPVLASVADKAKLVFRFNVLASILGLGYIIGLKYALIICAGSFVSWFLLVPLIAHFGAHLPVSLPPVTDGTLIGAMPAEAVFRSYVRHIGIGAIAAAGIMGILRSWRVVVRAFAMGFSELTGKKATATAERTDRDLPMRWVVVGLAVAAVVIWVFFRFSVLAHDPGAGKLALIALAIVLVISFLFTTVAARAIATVGTNPVSGMTLMTLILTSVLLVEAGLSGPAGMLAALLVGGVVCTALAMAGGLITDLKIGYWIGATPVVQQKAKFLGTIFAAATVGAVILLLHQAYGFVPSPEHPADKVLAAPQANAMAAVIKTLMSREEVPWLLYIVGVLVAITMQMIGVPSLAFALGMYIPLELNVPLVVGGLIAHWVKGSAKGNESLAQARATRGTLIASGFIAGGALLGVVAAFLKIITLWTGVGTGIGALHVIPKGIGAVFGASPEHVAEILGLLAYLALCFYMYWDAKRARGDA
ncbi:MAG: oligopeptide transporter, OPT family [Thermoanaerobaculum sp.]|nr:oligopeptide transporter, OPT family [Thermoanaerobaculum sp.]